MSCTTANTYRDDDMGTITILSYNFQPVNCFGVPNDIVQNKGSILLNPEIQLRLRLLSIHNHTPREFIRSFDCFAFRRRSHGGKQICVTSRKITRHTMQLVSPTPFRLSARSLRGKLFLIFLVTCNFMFYRLYILYSSANTPLRIS